MVRNRLTFVLALVLCALVLCLAASLAGAAENASEALVESAFGETPGAAVEQSDAAEPSAEPAPAPSEEDLAIPAYPGSDPADESLNLGTSYGNLDDPSAILGWYADILPPRGWSITAKVLAGKRAFMIVSRPGASFKITAERRVSDRSSYTLSRQR